MVAVETSTDDGFGSGQGDVVFLDGVELPVHEEANVVHEENYFVGSCHFEVGGFADQRSFHHPEPLLHVESFVVFFVRANYVATIVSHVGRQLVEGKFLGFLQFFSIRVHEDNTSLFFLADDGYSLNPSFFLSLVDSKIMHFLSYHLRSPQCRIN